MPIKKILALCFAFLLLGIGILTTKRDSFLVSKVEVIQPSSSPSITNEIIVEIAGAVEHPGVYRLDGKDARVQDLLAKAGDLRSDADLVFVSKNINRAAKISDGQKLYIPKVGEQSPSLSATVSVGGSGGGQGVMGTTSKGIQINTSSQKELESLDGIGPAYAQKIIEHRPYSDISELLSKKIIPSSVYEKNKNLLSL